MKKIVSLFLVAAVLAVLYTQRITIKDAFFSMSKGPVPKAVPFQDFVKTKNQNEENDTSEISGGVNVNSAAPAVVGPPRDTVQSPPAPEVKPSNDPSPDPLPIVLSGGAINLAVPFQPQAPHANWTLPYKEACEEAAAIMVDYYLQGKTLSADQMDSEILELVAWEKEWGYDIDVSMVELAQIVKTVHGYEARVIDIATAEDVRRELEKGRPVIIPLAGQEIGNPYYRQPGPLYHVMVIKGVTADGKFITNDPGTKRGADYIYEPAMLLKALGDWDGGAPEGPSRGLVLLPGS